MIIDIDKDALVSANIPKKFWALGKQDYVGNKHAFDMCVKFLKNLKLAIDDGLGLVLYGEHGSGKTFLGTYILKTAMVQKYSCYYINLDSLMAEQLNNNLSRICREYDVLMIDTVEGQKHEGHKNCLNTVVATRVDLGGATIIGSSLRIRNFTDKYSADLEQRLIRNFKEVTCRVESLESLELSSNISKIFG